MARTTITEALADIKTTKARIAKKREAIMRYFSRPGDRIDPLEKDGGSMEFVRKERQAISDLEQKIVRVRAAIQKANLETPMTVGTATKTVAEWLNWRREVSLDQKTFLNQMANTLNMIRQNAMRQGQALTDKASNNSQEIVVSVSEKELAKEIEEAENVLGSLDGKLSLLNATMTVDV